MENAKLIKKLDLTPLTGMELANLKDTRKKLGRWIIQENNPEARVELLNLYDRNYVKIYNVALIYNRCKN